MRAGLQIGWAFFVAVLAMLAIRALCKDSLRCSEQCGCEVIVITFGVLLVVSALGSRALDVLADKRGWR